MHGLTRKTAFTIKMKIILRRIAVVSLLVFLVTCAFGQNEKYTAPVEWEKYKVSEQEVSVLLPKLPIMMSGGDVCRQEETNKYAVYAENVVYGLNITFKTKQKNQGVICTKSKKFDKVNFDERLKYLKSDLKLEKQTSFKLSGLDFIKIENESFAYWLVSDLGNDRWFELWTTDAGESNAGIKKIIESLKIEKNPTGIEISKGSLRTLGDEITNDTPEVDANEKNQENAGKEAIPLRLVIKQPASYTDAARQAQFQGTVKLRVVFLASGGIGSISLIDAAPFGLTEQAIAVARKMVFIPARRNNINYSVTKLVEYHFMLY